MTNHRTHTGRIGIPHERADFMKYVFLFLRNEENIRQSLCGLSTIQQMGKRKVISFCVPDKNREEVAYKGDPARVRNGARVHGSSEVPKYIEGTWILNEDYFWQLRTLFDIYIIDTNRVPRPMQKCKVGFKTSDAPDLELNEINWGHQEKIPRGFGEMSCFKSKCRKYIRFTWSPKSLGGEYQRHVCGGSLEDPEADLGTQGEICMDLYGDL